ncbi:MAG: hypothetical protein IKO97_09650 [Erysipelotrichaceae bacterium]|nr:hypothetical protein [Erysipelotrichaceae bacterium]
MIKYCKIKKEKEEEAIRMKETKELMPEELGLVSGGRGMNAEEKASVAEINRQYCALRDRYYAEGRNDEWNHMQMILHDAVEDWYRAIKDAPEDHPTIPFSDFFDFGEYM